MACRLGGEEFVVMVPGATAKEAAALADKIRQNLEAKALTHEKNVEGKGAVTMSVGVAHTVPTPEQTPDGLYKAADKALYHAKQNGRNRVTVAQNPRDKAAAAVAANIQKLWEGMGRPDILPWKPYQIQAQPDPKTGQVALLLLKETTQPVARFTPDGKAVGLAPLGAEDLKVFESAAIKDRLLQLSAAIKAPAEAQTKTQTKTRADGR